MKRLTGVFILVFPSFQCSYMTIIESLNTYGVHYFDVVDKSSSAYLLGVSCKGIGQYKTTDRRIPERVRSLDLITDSNVLAICFCTFLFDIFQGFSVERFGQSLPSREKVQRRSAGSSPV